MRFLSFVILTVEVASREARCEESPSRKKISLTDPTARWTAAPGVPAFFAYSTNQPLYLQAGIIADVEATMANRSREVEFTKTMIAWVERRSDLKPHRLVGDTAYGTAMLGWMVGQEIAHHVPVWSKAQRNDGTFPISEFEWHESANEYRCLTGHALRSDLHEFSNRRTHITKADTIAYRPSQSDCKDCSMKDRSTVNPMQ